MKTLAQALGETWPVSVLGRKAARLGFPDLASLLALAASRGCRHYDRPGRVAPPDPGRELLPDAELVVLLLGGGWPYSPEAVRCAAQLARAPGLDASNLAFLARRERVERVLEHIAKAGIDHDSEGRDFWSQVLAGLPSSPPIRDAILPHWSRFVSMPGRWRGREMPVTWLKPVPTH